MSGQRNAFQALLSAIGVGEKSATVIGATFQVSSTSYNLYTWVMIEPQFVRWGLGEEDSSLYVFFW